jgi:hypothetical protein
MIDLPEAVVAAVHDPLVLTLDISRRAFQPELISLA